MRGSCLRMGRNVALKAFALIGLKLEFKRELRRGCTSKPRSLGLAQRAQQEHALVLDLLIRPGMLVAYSKSQSCQCKLLRRFVNSNSQLDPRQKVLCNLKPSDSDSFSSNLDQRENISFRTGLSLNHDIFRAEPQVVYCKSIM